MSNQACINCGKDVTSSSKICNYCGTAQDKYNNQLVTEKSNIPVATVTEQSSFNRNSVPLASAVGASQPAVATAQYTVPPPAISAPNDVPAAIEPPRNYLLAAAIGTAIPYATYDVSRANQNAELLAEGKDTTSPNSTSVGLAMLHLPTDSLKGSFEVPFKIRRFGILTSSVLDFSTAKFVNKKTIIRGGKLLGGFKIIIPRGVAVEVYGPLTRSKDGAVHYGEYNPDVPHPIIQVTGIELLGGVHVDINRTVLPLQIVGA